MRVSNPSDSLSPHKRSRWFASRFVSVMSLPLLLVACIVAPLSYGTACRTGWVTHAEDNSGVAIRNWELFIRHGRILTHFQWYRHGGMTLERQLVSEPYNTQRPGFHWHTFPADWTEDPAHTKPRSWLDRAGVEIVNHGNWRRSSVTRTDLRVVGIDLAWWMVLAILILPLIPWMMSVLRRRRWRREGRCLVCGYDLRASADRCPECGTTIMLLDSSSERTTP
jgi:hypothetical protein